MIRTATALLLLCAACTTTQDGNTPEDIAPTLSGGSGRAFDVGYDYLAGSQSTYRLAVTQDISFSVVGDESGLAGDDALPEQGRVVTDALTDIVYLISGDSTDQAITMDINATFPDLTTTAVVDGIELDPEVYDELTRALAAIQPIDFRVGVNDRNAVLTTGGVGGLDVLSGEVGALTSLSNNQLSRPLGPVFPEDRKLKVGQEWRLETSEDGPDGPIVVSTTYRVEETVEVDGRPHLLISSSTQTDGFELDFSEVFQSLFAGFASDESGGEPTEAALDQYAEIRFVVDVQPSTGVAETLYDLERRQVVSSDQDSSVELEWLLQTPDEATGEIAGFELSLQINQNTAFALQD